MMSRETDNQEIKDYLENYGSSNHDSLVDEVINEFGGVKKLAKAMHDVYEKSKDNSPNKIRVIDGIFRMLVNRRDRGQQSADDLDYMTLKQLEAMQESSKDDINDPGEDAEKSPDQDPDSTT